MLSSYTVVCRHIQRRLKVLCKYAVLFLNYTKNSVQFNYIIISSICVLVHAVNLFNFYFNIPFGRGPFGLEVPAFRQYLSPYRCATHLNINVLSPKGVY